MISELALDTKCKGFTPKKKNSISISVFSVEWILISPSCIQSVASVVLPDSPEAFL